MNLPTLPRASRRTLVASVLGVAGGAGTIGGMSLPLAHLAGLGPVGFFDYNHARVDACIFVGAVLVVGSAGRLYRVVLLFAGILTGLVVATAIDLYQALREVTGPNDAELAQMAHAMVAHSSLGAGAYVLPLCVVACIAAGWLGLTQGRVRPGATNAP